MCITNLSQLNAAYLLNAGGCTSITAQLADLLKRQQRRQGESVNILLN
ncbi:hypothetical protein [Aeromonas media]|uniref:Uncharacterized protein n=1 Tax=Aeromonas media TaxID=651 RepID=A0AAE6SN69_AERME|nr:hypothetical protein [Aeromonas media]QHQ53547.1 hypothetical protein GWI30_22050 [Aeromonas media]